MINPNLFSQIDKNRPVIAHAAGRMASFYIEQLGNLGISPVCFSDRDSRKHYTQICDRLVLPVQEAIQKYPDSYFYITANANDINKIADDLVDNFDVKRESILNFIIHEKRITCRFIEGNLNIRTDFLCPCCMYPNTPFRVKVRKDDIDGTVEDYLCRRKNASDIINSGAQRDFCLECPYLVEQYDCSFGNVMFSTINCDFAGVCNFECIYCDRSNKNFNLEGSSQHQYLSSILRSLEKISAIDNTTSLGFANDEITVNPFQNEFFEVAENYVSEIFTNASVFSENIVKASKLKENFHIIVSNDSGTAETFNTIKKRKLYEKVCENLRQYALNGVKIHMKYIFIPGINDNAADVDGFVLICKDICAEVVYIDKEAQIYSDNKDLQKDSLEAVRAMIEQLSKQNIRIVLGNYLTPTDKKTISEFPIGL